MEKLKIQTAKDLSNDLCRVYEELRDGSLSHGVANAAANIAGKIVKVNGLRFEQNKFLGKKISIDFIDGVSDDQNKTPATG